MSYILDALKKLEHDKSRKSRGDGMVNITGALFEHERPKPAGTAGWKIWLAVTVAVLVTFAATWQFLKPGRGRETITTRPATPAPQITQPVPVRIEGAPAPPVPPVAPLRPSSPVAPSVPPAKANPVRTPAQPSNPQSAPAPAAAATEDAAAELTLQELRKRTKDRKGQVVPVVPTIAAPADIKLSGIAWQEDRRARRAVVNGFLMQEGGVVLGARITDIFQDRVRFSLSGSVFEIPLSSSGISSAGK
jgi:general secretion pathway protein B